MPCLFIAMVKKLDHNVEIRPKSPDLNLETQPDIKVVRNSHLSRCLLTYITIIQTKLTSGIIKQEAEKTKKLTTLNNFGSLRQDRHPINHTSRPKTKKNCAKSTPWEDGKLVIDTFDTFDCKSENSN